MTGHSFPLCVGVYCHSLAGDIYIYIFRTLSDAAKESERTQSLIRSVCTELYGSGVLYPRRFSAVGAL